MSSGSRVPEYTDYASGEIVPASGIYEAIHICGKTTHEITLLQNRNFPTCGRCGYGVTFRWLRKAENPEKLHIVLHNIPD